MNLQNASGFWWLLPLAGVIVALYLLRMRRRDVQVPAVFLWPQRTEEVRANTLFQKLRFSWLMVLQILALTLLVAAFARPQFRQKGLSGKVTVVVIDASASMGATDVKPTRLDQAKSVVAEMVHTASPGDRIALIEAGPDPRVVFPLSQETSRQTEGLKSVHQYDSEADMGEALRLAAAIAGSTDGARIVVLSDGVFEKVEDFSPGKAVLTYQKIGSSAENLGFQALGTTEGPSGKQAYCGLKNYGLNPAKNVVSVFADGKVVDSADVTLMPGQVWGKTVTVPPGTKIVEAKLVGSDALAADNYAVSLIDPAASARVLLVGKGDLFLERALSLDPRVTLDKADRVPAPEKIGSAGAATYDIIVFDGVTEEPVKARGVLTFGAAGNGSPVKVVGESKNPVYVRSEDDPVVQGVSFEDTYIEKAERVVPTGGGRTVAESKDGPLVVVSNARKRQVYVSFSPLDSDFPLSVGFPVLVGNALDFLIGKESTNVLGVRACQPFVVPAEGQATATLTPAQGSPTEVKAHDDRLIVRETDRVGTYTLTVGKAKRTVYATMRSPVESAIQPQSNLEIGTTKVQAVAELSRFEDFWRPLLLVALMVLGIEWWAYARRS